MKTRRRRPCMTLTSSSSASSSPSSSLWLRVVAGLLLSNLLSLLLGAGIGICIYRRSVLYCICLLSRCLYGFCIYQRFVFHCICICVHVQDILYVVFIAHPDFFNIVFLTLHFYHRFLHLLKMPFSMLGPERATWTCDGGPAARPPPVYKCCQI